MDLQLPTIKGQPSEHIPVEWKAVSDERREVLHLISSPTVDRAGDVVVPKGALLDSYMRNPVVLRNHSYQDTDIIGKALTVDVQDDRILARTQFLDTEFGRTAYQLTKERIGGWSIGFRPIDAEPMKKGGGYRFNRWELLEYSFVAIPMNPEITNAVESMVQRGLVPEDCLTKFFTEPTPPTLREPDRATRQAPVPQPIIGAFDGVVRRLARFDAGQEIKRHVG